MLFVTNVTTLVLEYGLMKRKDLVANLFFSVCRAGLVQEHSQPKLVGLGNELEISDAPRSIQGAKSEFCVRGEAHRHCKIT